MFSTQSVEEAMRRGDRLVVLVGGRRIFSGTGAALLAAEGLEPDASPEAVERAFVRLVVADDPAAA
jgi:ABC-2 type transport system ATP-binding protein